MLGDLAHARLEREEGLHQLGQAVYRFLYVYSGDDLPSRGGIDFLSILRLDRRKPFSWRVAGTASFLTDDARSHVDFVFKARFEANREFTALRSYEIHFGSQPRACKLPLWSHCIRFP